MDGIIEFKRIYNEKTEKINSLNVKIEKLTWFSDFNDECLLLLNDLISSIKDAHSTLIKQYVSLNFIRSKSIAKEEISNFKIAIDELKESYQDLDSVFFFLPEIPDFKETTNQLSLI